MQAIILRAADILKTPIDESGAMEIARCSRGTPRVANRLLKRVSDFALVRAEGVINRKVARQALEMLEIDHEGLDIRPDDFRYHYNKVQRRTGGVGYLGGGYLGGDRYLD